MPIVKKNQCILFIQSITLSFVNIICNNDNITLKYWIALMVWQWIISLTKNTKIHRILVHIYYYYIWECKCFLVSIDNFFHYIYKDTMIIEWVYKWFTKQLLAGDNTFGNVVICHIIHAFHIPLFSSICRTREHFYLIQFFFWINKVLV